MDEGYMIFRKEINRLYADCVAKDARIVFLTDQWNGTLTKLDSVQSRLSALEKVAEAAHNHRVTVILSIHDASEILSQKEMDDICRTDEALKAALDAAKDKP